MDGQRCNRLVRWWGTPTRRGALGLALGAAAMVLGGGDAAATCTHLGNRCNRRRGDRCCGDGTCRGGRCECPRGAEEIRGACFFRGDCAPNATICDGKCGNTAHGAPYRDCYCGTSTENTTLCFKNASLCQPPCRTSADCPTGHACVESNCQGTPGTCLKPCRRGSLN